MHLEVRNKGIPMGDRAPAGPGGKVDGEEVSFTVTREFNGNSIETKDVYLAVASPTRYSDMLDVYRRFSIAPIDGLLFTGSARAGLSLHRR